MSMRGDVFEVGRRWWSWAVFREDGRRLAWGPLLESREKAIADLLLSGYELGGDEADPLLPLL